MRQSLILHPGSPCPPVERIEVEVSRERAGLGLLYAVIGDIAALEIPSPDASVRADELWKHTCFEAFIGTGPNYLELNFAPSGAWAAYRFEGYRSGRRNAGIPPPDIRTSQSAGRFELRAEARIQRWEGRLALAAVIEERNGRRSYWALRHPPGDPDFHHGDCFALELPAATGP